MSSLFNVNFPAPVDGAVLDISPRGAPVTGALRLENLRVDGGYARSRFGFLPMNGAAFDSKRVIDIFDRLFADGTSETLRCTRDTTQRSIGTAWSAITLDSAWTGADSDRFWCVGIPFGAETKGRLAIGNGINVLKTWQGGATNMNAYPSGYASKYAIVGDDARLFLGYTTEGGNLYAQRIRWTVIGLVNGGATDWTATGSGALDLRSDSYPITGFWKQGGRIFVGKNRAICALLPTGIATNAYSYETLQTNGEGLYARGSLVQFGNLVAFLTHRGIASFDGITLTQLLGANQLTFQQRLNYAALDQVTSVIDTFANRVGWGLPLDGATTPSEIWWYHVNTGHWEMDTIAHTALSLYSGGTGITIDGLAGTINALTGTIDSLSTVDPTPALIFGTTTGGTYQTGATRLNDNGALIQSTYVSSGAVPLGKAVNVAGRPHEIDEDDFLVVDAVAVRFLDMGYDYQAKIEVSGDGGQTWSDLGLVGVAAGGLGTPTVPRIVRAYRTGRIPVQDTVQVRLTSSTSDVLWGWTDVTVFVDIVGEKRGPNVLGFVTPPVQ